MQVKLKLFHTWKIWLQKNESHRLWASFGTGLFLGILLFKLGDWSMDEFTLKRSMTSDDGKSLYSLGRYSGRLVESLSLSKSEAQILTQGFQDLVQHRPARISSEDHQIKLNEFIESRKEKQIRLTKTEGQDYLKQFIKSGGLISLSGLGYRVLTPGTQKKPGLKDWVEVHYRGSLINGALIDATQVNKPVQLPMNGVIPGWTEGLQQIGEGGEIELVIPSHLAYKDAGSSPDIPPGATLVFRIQLLRVLDSGRVNK